MTLVHQFAADDSIITAQKTLYQGFFMLREYRVKFRLFEGGWSEEIRREIFVRGEVTVVLLYDPNNDKVVLIEQFRPATIGKVESSWLFEIVAGMNELGEKAEDVAHREAMEEAGCEIKKLIPIYKYFTSPGGTNEQVNLFCGIVDSEGVGGIHGVDAEHEDIKVHVVAVDDALKMVMDGIINNAATIIALQWLHIQRLKIKIQPKPEGLTLI